MGSTSRIFALLALGLSSSCSQAGPAPVAPTANTPAFRTKPAANTPGSRRAIDPNPTIAPAGVLVGAGDIGYCGTSGAEATSRLLDRIPGIVFTAGDNAYMSGTRDEFRRCYEPTWGRHRYRTQATPGNHEYEQGQGASGYFEYFGAGVLGPHGSGYYRYEAGPWTVFALNSEIPSGPGSPQSEWLRGELSASPAYCTAVIWHRPLFSSGQNGDNPDMRDLWRTLYEFDVDLIINGHDHTYERFAPQDPNGRLDPVRGIREFIVGTGGAPLYQFPALRANSEARAAVWGVAAFTLASRGFEWEFVPVDGERFRDAGSASCH